MTNMNEVDLVVDGGGHTNNITITKCLAFNRILAQRFHFTMRII